MVNTSGEMVWPQESRTDTSAFIWNPLFHIMLKGKGEGDH